MEARREGGMQERSRAEQSRAGGKGAKQAWRGGERAPKSVPWPGRPRNKRPPNQRELEQGVRKSGGKRAARNARRASRPLANKTKTGLMIKMHCDPATTN